MKDTRQIIALLTFVFFISITSSSSAQTRWQTPLSAGTGLSARAADSVMTLRTVYELVAANNPRLTSMAYRQEAARSLVGQAGKWANPELSADFEELDPGSPGFTESEVTISLSQELELFGQRTARKEAAGAELEAVRLQSRLSAYELFLEAKAEFYRSAHAQKHHELTESSVRLAETILENIQFRINNGAALQSEFLLAQLQLQRHQLQLSETEQSLKAARMLLASLWNSSDVSFQVTDLAEPDLTSIYAYLENIDIGVDSTRDLLALAGEAGILRAERNLARAEAKPNVTVSGGYKRIMADGSGSLLFGFSLPLPFLNRNQGVTESIGARLHSLDYDLKRVRTETRTAIHTGTDRLRQLIEQHRLLDTGLLPTAEKAYGSLQKAYQAGRVPYTSLLEAERSLVELRFEHNDILLTIYEQIIALERITGVMLDATQIEGTKS